MKNRFRILVVLCLLVCCLSVSALAAGAARIEVSSAQAAPGEEVSLTVSIADNPGFAGYDMRVDYDAGVLELTGFALSRTAGALSSAAPETGMATFASLDSFMDDGVLATLTFHVREDAQAGSFSVGIAEADFFDIDENFIPVESVYGTLTISAGETVSAADETENPTEERAETTPTPTPLPTITPEEAEDGSVFRAYVFDDEGGVEELPLTEEANGLTVVTDAEKPFSISWLTPEEDAAARTEEQSESSEALTAEAPTDLRAVAWIAAAVVAALGVVLAWILLRRKPGK